MSTTEVLPYTFAGTESISSTKYNGIIQFFVDLLSGVSMPLTLTCFVEDTPAASDYIRAAVMDSDVAGTSEFTDLRIKYRSGNAGTLVLTIAGTDYTVLTSGDPSGVIKDVALSPTITVTQDAVFSIKVKTITGTQAGISITMFGTSTPEISAPSIVYALDVGSEFATIVNAKPDEPAFNTNLDELWNSLNEMVYSQFDLSWARNTPDTNTYPTYRIPRDMTVTKINIIAMTGGGSGASTWHITRNGVTVATVSTSGLTPPNYTTASVNLTFKAGDYLGIVGVATSGAQRDVTVQVVPRKRLHS